MSRLKILILLWFAAQALAGQDTIDIFPAQPGSLVYRTESRSLPRPLKIYYLRVNLTSQQLEVFTLTGKDPDGAGRAESSLSLPGDLFNTFHPLAAINANAFAGLPGSENDIRGWYDGRPVDIMGMVVHDNKVVSPTQKKRTPFWIDAAQHPHIGNPKPGDTVLQAVSDWTSPLLINNQIVTDSTITTLHPRSALGFDDTGKWVLMIVVDGRQNGFSEGMSLYELAKLCRSQGCTQAINLDGGGSSIMMIRDPDGKTQTVNRPSGLNPRPIPVMIGIRIKK